MEISAPVRRWYIRVNFYNEGEGRHKYPEVESGDITKVVLPDDAYTFRLVYQIEATVTEGEKTFLLATPKLWDGVDYYIEGRIKIYNKDEIPKADHREWIVGALHEGYNRFYEVIGSDGRRHGRGAMHDNDVVISKSM